MNWLSKKPLVKNFVKTNINSLVLSLCVSFSSQANDIIDRNIINCTWNDWEIKLTHLKQMHKSDQFSDMISKSYFEKKWYTTQEEVQKQIYDIVLSKIDNWYEWGIAAEGITEDWINKHSATELLRAIWVSYYSNLNFERQKISIKEMGYNLLSIFVNHLISIIWNINIWELISELEKLQEQQSQWDSVESDILTIKSVLSHIEKENINNQEMTLLDILNKEIIDIKKLRDDYENSLIDLKKKYILGWTLIAVSERGDKILPSETTSINQNAWDKRNKMMDLCSVPDTEMCKKSREAYNLAQEEREDKVLELLYTYSKKLELKDFLLTFWALHDFSDAVKRWNQSHDNNYCLNEITLSSVQKTINGNKLK